MLSEGNAGVPEATSMTLQDLKTLSPMEISPSLSLPPCAPVGIKGFIAQVTVHKCQHDYDNEELLEHSTRTIIQTPPGKNAQVVAITSPPVLNPNLSSFSGYAEMHSTNGKYPHLILPYLKILYLF